MKLSALILRSLRFHARSHLGALLGAIVSSAVLAGALAVGDSVRESLRRMGLVRLGQIHHAIFPSDRFFTASLADHLQGAAGAAASAVIQLPGTASTGDGSARANRVQVNGVISNFWSLALEPEPLPELKADEAFLNEPLARQLNAAVGDSIILRVPRPSQLSRDAPISPQEDDSAALRVKIAAIVPEKNLGRFSLQANQAPPFNAFVSRGWLQDRLKLPGKANLLALGATPNPGSLGSAVAQNWTLADGEMELRPLTNSAGTELRTSRVFIDAPVGEAARQAASNSVGILTYFVNELALNGRSTPYSMVTAAEPPLLPADMKDDEIVISAWLAEDLQAKPGDELQLTYYSVGLMRKLEERQAKFRVREIYGTNSPLSDASLMPDFPGMTDSENCRDWDTGFPIDTERIRDKDEKYWDEYKGTPKACVTLAAGQRLWSNRFGNLTAVRYPSATDTNALAASIQRGLDPALIGLSLEPVMAQALAASAQSQDFGGLFIGFSFFLIAAALLLMALLFQFGVEQRAGEVGTLLAVGFRPRQVRRIFLLEGGALCLIGSVIGAAAGIGYAQAMLHGLSTIWRSAVNTSALEYHAHLPTIVGGAIGGMLTAWGAIWLALRQQAKQPARVLLAEGGVSGQEVSGGRKFRWSLAAGLLAGLGSAALAGLSAANASQANPGLFFGAGALLLIAGLAFSSAALSRLESWGSHAKRSLRAPSLLGLGLRNAARRRRRSLATVILLACGSFLIASIGVFRLDSDRDAQKRGSGAGGFALIGESTTPIVQDLNAAEGREVYGIDKNAMAGVEFVPFRVKDGDDASCLNLNRAQKPRILGAQPELLSQRKAFSFAGVAKGLPKDDPWMLLKGAADDAIPAIGDAASIQWALGKKLGDVIEYTDDRGKTFKLRLVAGAANSILQGSLIISEEHFVARFPDESGYRMFLIDAPSNQTEAVSAALTRSLRDRGFEATPAARRLAAFNAVQNTYLSTFQALGGLGLLLGSFGLGVVVLRNVLERRSELAALMALGFRKGAVRLLVALEHGGLLIAGLGIGVAAALVAVAPAALAQGAGIFSGSLLLTLAGALVSGLVWTLAATWLALKGNLIEALRKG